MKIYITLALLSLALTSKASQAAIGYQGGFWSAKVENVVKQRITQCSPKTSEDCKKCCIGAGGDHTMTVTQGTKATVTANISAETTAAVGGSVWKFAKVEAGFTATVGVSGSYELDNTSTGTVHAKIGANECGNGLGLDQQTTRRWTEYYMAIGQTKLGRTKQEIQHVLVSTTRPCSWGGSLPVAFKSGTISADGTVTETAW